jgi:hypothetical protein
MRAPESGDECRPGGSCPDCNPREATDCRRCGEPTTNGKWCRDCEDGMREDADEARAEARREER